jgi:Putative transposase/Transposase zinc-binding domain
MSPKLEVADVLTQLGDGVENIGLNTWQLRSLSALRRCRTAALGGHIDACDGCGNISISYNSCRNRHCPKCQGHKREEWIQAREAELLPVPYFHVVFTLPEALNSLAMSHPKEIYDSLFEAAWATIHTFGKNKNLQMGMISILHTWGQNLSLHPHLHCIVPGGGVDDKNGWRNIRKDGKFLFCVKSMSKVFRAKYVAALSHRIKIEKSIRDRLFDKNWVVFAKKSFGSNRTVVEYLGRYTHKIAISNHRLQQIDEHTISFGYKDYRLKGQKKTMTLTHGEFVRRFAMHILPKRFVRIRHYGILSSTWKRTKLKLLQVHLKVKPKEKSIKTKLRVCPCCQVGRLITIEHFDKRGPPTEYLRHEPKPTPCNV